MGPQPFITLDDVSIRLRGEIIFEGVSWEMWSDEHWAVIGPNASGKSVLLKALCGNLPVVKGRIIYDFLNDKEDAAQDSISYVAFEAQRGVLGSEAYYQERWNSALNEDTKTVSEYLKEKEEGRISKFHVVSTYTGKKFYSRKKKVVALLGIKGLFGKKVVELSNGERRKVTIARALLKEPALLILDNPFSGLDEDFRKKFGKILGNLMRGKMRVIVAMTNRDEIPSGITHVLALNDCRVVGKVPLGEYTSNTVKSKMLTTAAKIITNDKSQGETVVKMENVSVFYQEVPILRKINWTVKKAEKWALLGPNGAGKTTLLSLILADNPQAYANKIELFGKKKGSGESIWEIKEKIGWVSPELQLYYPRDATALDVACSGWFDSVGLFRECTPRRRNVALNWLREFGLLSHADSVFADLSEGQQRLALLARAMVKDPPLLLLDEPCQGLDASNRDKFLKALDFVCRRTDKTIIYVTHRTDELPKCITHVLKLKDGHIEGLSRYNMRPHIAR